jgi:polyisoprenoid-binding protein YceI
MKNIKNVQKSSAHVIGLLLLLITCSYSTGIVPTTAKSEAVILSFSSSETLYNNIGKNSHIQWKASHIGGVDPRQGKIFLKKIVIVVREGSIMNARAVVDMNSLIVEDMSKEDITDLTGHLKSSDFFDTKKFTTSKFELTSIMEARGTYNSKVTANLTLLGVTKSISFMANIQISENVVSIISESFKIDRSDWGLTYNAEGTAGVPLDYLISDEVGFNINISVTK